MANENERDSRESGNQNANDPRHKHLKQDPQQSDIRRPNDVNQDPSKKAPGHDFDRKDREGSEDIEKRRAS